MALPGKWTGLWLLVAALSASAEHFSPAVFLDVAPSAFSPAAAIGRSHLRSRVPLRMRGGSAFAALEDEVEEDVPVCASFSQCRVLARSLSLSLSACCVQKMH